MDTAALFRHDCKDTQSPNQVQTTVRMMSLFAPFCRLCVFWSSLRFLAVYALFGRYALSHNDPQSKACSASGYAHEQYGQWVHGALIEL
jgi:hypothetical protein